MIQREITTPIKIEKKVYQGYGLTKWKDTTLFVHYGVPGDVVEAKIILRKRGFSFAEIDKLKEASPARIAVDCDAFGKCGGCDWLNIRYENQLKYKEEILNEFFYKYPSEVLPMYGCKQPEHYRNKCFYPLAMKNGKPEFGMFARGSHSVTSHEKCFLQPEVFDELAKVFCHYITNSKETIYNEHNGIGNIRHIGFRMAPETGEVLVIIVTTKRRIAFSKQLVRALHAVYGNISGVIQNINAEKGNVIMGRDYKLLDGEAYMNGVLAGKKFKLSYDAFFQVNNETATAMIEYCKEQVKEDAILIDAYCGTGTIGISLADKVQKVIGIDFSLAAIRNARQNTLINEIGNCEFIRGDVAKEISEVLSNSKSDTIIFDPPRKGLEPETIAAVTESKIPQVIYISCNPSTQIRDIKLFIEAGYELKSRRGFDMFPQTWHIENVVVLECK